jgi:hypothetical protein
VPALLICHFIEYLRCIRVVLTQAVCELPINAAVFLLECYREREHFLF